MSSQARGKQRAIDPMSQQPHSDPSQPKEHPEFLKSTFPPVVSKTQKQKIIKDWQKLMDFEDLTREVCAICSQSMARRDINYVLPEDIDLALLQNPHLPVNTLLTTYDLEAYNHTILDPKGLHNLKQKGPIDMCASCYLNLVEHKKQPLDLIANFQYYV
jgi:hypothetical protein